MKILFVTPRIPYPPLKGDSLRSYYFIKELAKRHSVDLITFSEGENEATNLREMTKYCAHIETVRFSQRNSFFNVFRSLIDFKPLQINYYYDRLMRQKVINTVKNNRYDIIHMVLQRMLPYVEAIEKGNIVLDHIDALSLNMQRRAQTEANVLKKAAFFGEYLNMKRFEQKSSAHYSASIITSDIDRQALRDTSIEVIPNGVDTDYFAPEPREKDIEFIFTGNMGYFPNVDAVVYFCEEIFPWVLRVYPSSKVYIVGIKPGKRVMDLADNKNIIVTGYVEDIRDYLNRAKVFVAPLRCGSGIQNKILEAMATALPVVTTSYGNAGIKALNGRQIIVRDNPSQFAEAMIALLEDEKQRWKLGDDARRFVQEGFNWGNRVQRLEKIYQGVIEERNRKGIH